MAGCMTTIVICVGVMCMVGLLTMIRIIQLTK